MACALGFAATLSAIASYAKSHELPHYPFSGWIGPARISELRLAQALDPQGVDDRLVERSARAAVTAPLSSEPFILAALRDFPTKDSLGSKRSELFLVEAVRRQPRSRVSHLLLVRRSIAEGDLGEAIERLARLNRLEPDLVAQMMRVVGGQIRNEGSSDQAARALADHPELLEGIVHGIVAGPAQADVVAHFARAIPARLIRESTAATSLIARLVRDGRIAQARAVWAATGEGGGDPKGRGVEDPAFASRVGRPPFNWEFLETASGVAEWQAPGSVYVEYYGRRSGPLLRQLVHLSAGRFRVVVEFSAQPSGTGTIGLRIECTGGVPVLHEAALAQQRAGRARQVFPFSIPAECPGQVISLVGLANDRRRGHSITVHRIGVEQAGDKR
jgi:hypothetical protein